MPALTILVGPGVTVAHKTGLHPYDQPEEFAPYFLDALKRNVTLATNCVLPLEVAWALKYESVQVVFSELLNVETRSRGKAFIVRVIYVGRGGRQQDISGLDPASEDDIEATWGGLNWGANKAGELVRNAVNRKGR